MVSREGDKYHPENPDFELKPLGIIFQRRMFPPKSVGWACFPEILAERQRPEAILNQPLTSLWSPKNRIFKGLQSRGLTTIAAVLRLPETELPRGTKTRVEIKNRLENYLENLAITPQAKLLGAIFGAEQDPLPPERERELTNSPVFKEVLATLTGREAETINLRFGLRDGIGHALEEIGKGWEVTGERIRQIESKALRKLRHPTRSRQLKAYFSLPEQSFGRQAFGAVIRKDLPQLEGRISDLHLSPAAEGELQEFRLFHFTLSFLLEVDLRSVSLTAQTQEEIERELQRVKREGVARRLIEEVFPKKPSEPPANNLLPEISLVPEELVALCQRPIEDLGLSARVLNCLRRAEVTKIGDLLAFPREELAGIRQFGHYGAWEVGKKLQELLLLPQEKYSEDFIPQLLVLAFPVRAIALEVEESELKNRAEISTLRQLVKTALSQGQTSVEEIHNWLVERKERIFGLRPRSWIVQAMIEYVLKHQEEESES